MRNVLMVMALALVLAGCEEERDWTPPAAPRGLYSITGDHAVRLEWLHNTEGDVAGYRVYIADCPSGGDCPYTRTGTTAANAWVVDGLANGVTRYFAVSAVDYSGNESDLSYAEVLDTPRPAGALSLLSAESSTVRSGWDLSAFSVVPSNSPDVDLVFSDDGVTWRMIAPYTDTDIQDAGFATTLDAVDFAPPGGWSPTGTVELVSGHCYVVWTREDHYAKFRVTGLAPGQVAFDWAYQTAQGNPELRVTRPPVDGPRTPRGTAVAAR
jgi:hypothetical protein